MTLTPQAVHELAIACLFQDGEDRAGAVQVEGIMADFRFDPKRIAEHDSAIGALLAELPDEFHLKKGGGWSFLNACMDRHGHLWTGEHRTVETLCCLGIAASRAAWLQPRDLWSSLPGEMPYLAVLP